MKKITAILLCLIMVFALAACSDDEKSDETKPSAGQTHGISQQIQLTEEQQALVDALTPEGAVFMENIPNHFGMTSEQSMEELIAFYTEATEKLELSPFSENPGGSNDWWSFSSPLGESGSLFIQLGRISESTIQIIVNYSL